MLISELCICKSISSTRSSVINIQNPKPRSQVSPPKMERFGVLMVSPMTQYLEFELEKRFNAFKPWTRPDSTSAVEYLAENAGSIRAVVVTTRSGADAELIDSLPNLEIVSTYSVGFDKIDLGKCRERGIRVTNMPDVLTDDVADTIVGLAIAVVQRICVSDGLVRSGEVKQCDGSFGTMDKAFTRRFQALIAPCCFVVMFSVFCLIIWGASRPYKAAITVKSLSVSNFYIGEGTDFSGVPTKMLTLNGSLKMNVYNPAPLFGIHVSSSPVNLIYSEIPVATGQVKKYYQPRKSHRTILVNLEGKKVPLYGAGSGLAGVSQSDADVPLTLSFEVRSRGNVVGKLVRIRHRKRISCPLVINSTSNTPIRFKKDSCTYE